MEYVVSALKPRLRKDIGALERVQKIALRIPYELHNLDGYNERLSAVRLTTLKARRDRSDMIQAYKLINR